MSILRDFQKIWLSKETIFIEISKLSTVHKVFPNKQLMEEKEFFASAERPIKSIMKIHK